MAVIAEKQLLQNAKKILEGNGLEKLPLEIQEAFIQRMAEISKWRQEASSRWFSSLRGYSEATLREQENTIINECKSLSRWMEGFEQSEKLPKEEQEKFIIRAYYVKNPKVRSQSFDTLEVVENNLRSSIRNLLKSDPAIKAKINDRLKTLGDYNKLSPLMKIAYPYFYRELEESIINQTLASNQDIPKLTVDIEQIVKQIETAKVLEKEGKLDKIAKEWSYEGAQSGNWDNEDAFVDEISKLLKFTVDRGDLFHNSSKEILENYSKEMPGYKNKFPNEYQGFLNRILSLEEERERALYHKDASFNNKKYETALNSIKTEVESHIKTKLEQSFEEEIANASLVRLNAIPNNKALTNSQQTTLKQHITELEKERLLFENQYKVSIFDDKQFGVGGAISSMIGLGDRTARRNALLAKYKKLINESSVIIREQIKDTQLEIPDELKIVPHEVREILKKELLDIHTDMILVEQGEWQHISDATIDSTRIDNPNVYQELNTLRDKYKNGELVSTKPSLAVLHNIISEKIQQVDAHIEMAVKFETTPGLEAFKQLTPKEQMNEIKAFCANIAMLEKYQLLETANQLEVNRLKHPDLPIPAGPTINRPARYTGLSHAEKIEYLEQQLSNIRQEGERITGQLKDFTKKYYKDPYLKDLDRTFGFVEPPPQGIMGDLKDGVTELLTQVWYSPRLTAALQGGMASAYVGMRIPILGPLTGLYTAGVGGLLSAIKPGLVRPLTGAATAMAVSSIIPGAGGIGGAVGAATVGITVQQALDQNPKLRQWMSNAGSKIWKFITTPFYEFADAYKKYQNGNKLYNGFRMFGIVLGAIVGIAAFVALNVFTAGLPVIGAVVVSVGLLGGYALATASANLVGAGTKKLVSLVAKSQVGFADPDKYLLHWEAIKLLGRNKEGHENAVLIGKHFEKRIVEMSKIVKTLEKNSADPPHDRTLGTALSYLGKISDTMDKIKEAGADGVKIKSIIDQYIKEEYAAKRAEYLTLTGSMALADLQGAEGNKPKPKPVDDIEKLKQEMLELSGLNEVSKHISVAIKEQERLAILDQNRPPVAAPSAGVGVEARVEANARTQHPKPVVAGLARGNDVDNIPASKEQKIRRYRKTMQLSKTKSEERLIERGVEKPKVANPSPNPERALNSSNKSKPRKD